MRTCPRIGDELQSHNPMAANSRSTIFDRVLLLPIYFITLEKSLLTLSGSINQGSIEKYADRVTPLCPSLTVIFNS